MKPNLIPLAAVIFALGCAGLRSDSTRDARLQGEWKCVSATIDGKALPDETTKALRLAITETRYITEKGNETLFDSTYRIDRTKTPAQIFMLGTEGALTGKEVPGIYEISGDTLRICYALPGDSPPITFESAQGSKAQFIVWRRAIK
jgi:uncharacterized protein (TIGR03067 family)